MSAQLAPQRGESMKMGSEVKKRKINPPKRPRCISPTTLTPTTQTPTPTRTPTSSPTPMVKEVLPRFKDAPTSSGIPLCMERAKNFAIAQTQQDRCTANFRIYDSEFGNFLIPVLPTRAELSE